jgi:hypothetical protein
MARPTKIYPNLYSWFENMNTILQPCLEGHRRRRLLKGQNSEAEGRRVSRHPVADAAGEEREFLPYILPWFLCTVPKSGFPDFTLVQHKKIYTERPQNIPNSHKIGTSKPPHTLTEWTM